MARGLARLLRGCASPRRMFASCPPAGTASHCLTELPARAVLCVRGLDAHRYLQGLVTSDVRRLARGHDAQFCALLDGKGRTLFEAILSRDASGGGAPGVLLDVHAPQASALLTHLRRFTLRARVEVQDLRESHAVWALPPLQQ